MNTLKNIYRNKSQLIAMVLSQKNETKATIESLRDEVKEMNTNFNKLRLMLVLLKQLAIFLWKSQLIQSGSSGQMPSTLVENANIYTTTEPWRKVCQIFKAIGAPVDKNNIDDSHRVRDKERTIVKFLRRKDCK